MFDFGPPTNEHDMCDPAEQEIHAVLVDELGFQPCDAGHYLGRLGSAPCLAYVLPLSPLSFSFKVRLLPAPLRRPSKGRHPSHRRPEQDTLDAHPDARVTTDVNGDYLWLTFENADTLTRADIGALVKIYVETHAHLLPLEADLCMKCLETKPTRLIQMESKVSALCESCAENMSQQRTDVTPVATEIRSVSAAAVTVIVGAMAWSVVWMTYSRAFELMGLTSFKMPEIVAYALFFGLGIGIGWPISWIARSLRMEARQYRRTKVLGLTLGLVALGELFYVMLAIWTLFGHLDVDLIRHAYLPIAIGSERDFFILRIISSVGVAAALSHQFKAAQKHVI